MPLFPLPVEEFGGLNLRDAPDEIGFTGAVDLANVELRSGRIKSRMGWTAFVTFGVQVDRVFAFRNSGGFPRIVALSTAAPRIWNGNASAFIDDPLATVGGPRRPAIVSKPGAGNEYIALAGGGGGAAPSTYHVYDGGSGSAGMGAFTAPGVAVFAATVGTQVPDNRVVLGNIQAAGGRPSRVMFSDPGDPLTFGANNFVDVGPYFNDEITAIDTVGSSTIAFQPTCFHVFYGNSTDATGNPIFNYRTFDLGIGCVALDGTAQAPEGIYFIGSDGIYLTNGGPPTKVSGILDPFFRGQLSEASFATLPARAALTASGLFTESLFWWRGRLFYNYDDGVNGGNQLVYDTESRLWSYWNMAGAPQTAVTTSAGTKTVYLARRGAFGVGQFDGTQTTDNGSAITSRYQSGFDNIAPPRRFAAHYLFGNTRKRLRKWKVTGTGAVSLAIAHDFNSPGTASSLTLGTSPAIKDAWHNIATRGQLLSYKFSSTSAWTVQKLTAYLAGSEPPLLGNPSDK